MALGATTMGEAMGELNRMKKYCSIRSNSALVSLSKASRTGRARALMNAERPGLMSRWYGSILIPSHCLWTKTLRARSEVCKSSMSGQAAKIPGET